MRRIYKPTILKELKELVDNLDINLGDIDTSLITDMNHLFYKSKRKDFSGIENWNVSNVTNMARAFQYSNFNGDISNWNVSNVLDMNHMFAESKFNGDISNWNVSKVKDFSWMFFNTKFKITNIFKFTVHDDICTKNMFLLNKQ